MATSEGAQPPVAAPEVDQPPASPQPEVDCVITTVVSGNEGGLFESLPPMDLGDLGSGTRGSAVAEVPQDLLWLVAEIDSTRKAAQSQAEQLAAMQDRLGSLETVPASLEGLSRATRQELERCANVLFGHDRALTEARDRLEALTSRLAELDGRPAAEPSPRPAALLAPPAAPAPQTSQVDDQALARILDQLDGLTRRLVAMEARVEPLEPVPTVVQALRRAVRDSDDLLAAEVAARESQVAALADDVGTQAQAREEGMRRLLTQDLDRMAALAKGQAEVLEAVNARIAAAEARLAPLDSAPSDIEALSRILRRELDALTTDAQARDQMLRRALQNEIDQLHAASASREQAAAELVTRLAAVESRLGETTDTHAGAIASATDRLGALESRVALADELGPQLEALRELMRTELEQVRADAKAHDQVMGEITRKFSALDGRMARFDPVPGELQSLRTALRQEAERSVSQLRAVEERVAQLAWVPGEFQEARKRIIALASGVQLGQDSMRGLEASLASTNDRLLALGARLGAVPAPGAPEAPA
jgi:chromosome segregation ATPase